MYSFHFWRWWLIVVTGGVMVYALSLIFLPDLTQPLFDLMLFSSPDTHLLFSDDANFYIIFANSVLGAVLVGWMVTFQAILIGMFRPGQRHVWTTLALSVGVWYVIDTGFSLVMGSVAHAIFNSLFLVLFAVPLTATYREFFAHQNDSQRALR